MRTNFSPTLEAARRLCASATPTKANTGSAPPFEPRWCEWPRRTPPTRARTGIWQALQQIQARHA
ncbi:MAG: hypothetical protein PSW75_01400 [bacterium]|nr:hypothetical protein [bacterium]MDI1334974.1 hypothetical protein [Lacunisphaera sp.]